MMYYNIYNVYIKHLFAHKYTNITKEYQKFQKTHLILNYFSSNWFHLLFYFLWFFIRIPYNIDLSEKSSSDSDENYNNTSSPEAADIEEACGGCPEEGENSSNEGESDFSSSSDLDDKVFIH